jgi:hypothetical protein
VERHGAEGVGQRLLVPASAEPGVPSLGWGGLLVQRLLLLRLWPGLEAGRRVEACVATKAYGRCCPTGTRPGYIVMCPYHGWS